MNKPKLKKRSCVERFARSDTAPPLFNLKIRQASMFRPSSTAAWRCLSRPKAGTPSGPASAGPALTPPAGSLDPPAAFTSSPVPAQDFSSRLTAEPAYPDQNRGPGPPLRRFPSRLRGRQCSPYQWSLNNEWSGAFFG